jgi:hypothetical protein
MQELLPLAAVGGTLAIGCRHTISASAPRRAYIACKTFVDRTARVVMLAWV